MGEWDMNHSKGGSMRGAFVGTLLIAAGLSCLAPGFGPQGLPLSGAGLLFCCAKKEAKKALTGKTY
jgi:hypothetical protein